LLPRCIEVSFSRQGDCRCRKPFPLEIHGASLYNGAMTTKEKALKTIEQLPESASWEDIQERINFIVGVVFSASSRDRHG